MSWQRSQNWKKLSEEVPWKDGMTRITTLRWNPGNFYRWSQYAPNIPIVKLDTVESPQWSSFADSLILGSGSQLYNVLDLSCNLYLGVKVLPSQH